VRLQAVLEAGYTRSSTFRGLIDALERSDLIVYVTPQFPARGPYSGELRFVRASGGVRYLRIQVRQQMNAVQLTAMIAHELQHAAEVAAVPSVVDAASMWSLYQRIGYRVGTHRHETATALRTAARVEREMIAPVATPGATRPISSIRK
jgi:hypothetical protein